MGFRNREWDELFSRSVEGDLPAPRKAPRPMPSATQLEDLWAQSLALRDHALRVRSVSMEVRAVARDVRLRRENSGGA
jgi:hypothetical protein